MRQPRAPHRLRILLGDRAAVAGRERAAIPPALPGEPRLDMRATAARAGPPPGASPGVTTSTGAKPRPVAPIPSNQATRAKS